MGGLQKLFMAVIIGALLALPASAMGQSATGGYKQPGGVVQDQIQAEPAQAAEAPARVTAAAPSNDSAQLPFTGFDLALVVGAGGVLLLLGLGMRRFTRASEVV
jgi:predicted cobalt transporter CbtA